jgi:exo-1,4-beta-D-glucosaminidase
LEGVTFVVLTLKDTVGKTISNNSYWLAPKEDFNALTDMPQTHVNVKLEQTKADKSNRQWTFQLTNPSDRIAFFVRLQLVNHGEEVLPSFWSANYVMLQPHQSMMITVDVPKVLLKGNNASVQIEGWNLTTEKVALPALM